MTVIAWHAWEPALTRSDRKASSGGGEWLHALFLSLRERGHKILWVSDNGDVAADTDGTVTSMDVGKEADVLFCAWRWRMPEYPERMDSYLEQMVAIGSAHSHNKRIIVHDQDHKIDVDDCVLLQDYRARIYVPHLNIYASRSHNILHYPNPYEFLSNTPFGGDHDLIYVGNNYERFTQAKRFIGEFASLGNFVQVFGNWVEPGPGREDPEKVKAAFPDVHFGGRLDQSQIIPMLRRAACTVHLFKPTYGATGFMTMRWAEAAAAGIPAFVPNDFVFPVEWRDKFRKLGLIVPDGYTMARALRSWYLKPDEWTAAVQLEQEFVSTFMCYEPWFELFEH